MPRYKDACGCYNKQDARELGLTAAVVWYDVLNTSELLDANPFWYDQRRASERLGIPYQTISRAIATLVDKKRITSRAGYRPNTTIKTTWITILTEDVDDLQNDLGEHQKSQNEISKKSQNEISILKETKEEDIVSEIPNSTSTRLKFTTAKRAIELGFKEAGVKDFKRPPSSKYKQKVEDLLGKWPEEYDGEELGFEELKSRASAYIRTDWVKGEKSISHFLSFGVVSSVGGGVEMEQKESTGWAPSRGMLS